MSKWLLTDMKKMEGGVLRKQERVREEKQCRNQSGGKTI